jgi:hypothetical protein
MQVAVRVHHSVAVVSCCISSYSGSKWCGWIQGKLMWMYVHVVARHILQ